MAARLRLVPQPCFECGGPRTQPSASWAKGWRRIGGRLRPVCENCNLDPPVSTAGRSVVWGFVLTSAAAAMLTLRIATGA